MNSSDALKKYDKRPPGEAQVYLSGMGLAVGVLIMLWLLFTVVSNGLAAFWPEKVVELTLKDGKKLYGEERAREPIRDVGKVIGHKIRFFTGNRDLLGQSTIFVPEQDVSAKTNPKGVMNLERMEWGNVIAEPVELELENGVTLKASDPDFTRKLSERIAFYEKLRGQVKSLEKGRIGALSRQIETDRRKLRAISYKKDKNTISEDEAARREAEMNADIAGATGESTKYIEEVRRLREGLEKETLKYKLADGKESQVKLGSLLNFYYPNELGFWGRLSEFFSKLWSFLSQDPREANTEGGVFPCIVGTLLMTVVMSLVVTPLGVLAAVYLREYAKQGPFVRLVRVSVNNLAGVPSIVFGVFGLGFFVYGVGATIDDWFYPAEAASGMPVFKSGNILWASLTLSLLTLPVVIVATEESLSSVSRGLREAALACGASKWQALQRVILPSAMPGVMTGVILAMARGAGEVAPLMVVGVVKLAPELPIDYLPPFGLDRKFMHLGFHIYDLGFQSPDAEAAKPMVYATTLLLITIVVTMNLAAIIIRNRLRKKLAATTF